MYEHVQAKPVRAMSARFLHSQHFVAQVGGRFDPNRLSATPPAFNELIQPRENAPAPACNSSAFCARGPFEWRTTT